MIRLAFNRGLDRRRLRLLLVVFFLALGVPTAALVVHTYRQLKWESFHRYRGLAIEITERIDGNLVGLIDSAEAASFADYAFLVVEGGPESGYLQPSPLSAVPLQNALPGAIGYFQVDSDGVFSTPFVPPESVDATTYGIAPRQLAERRALEDRILTVLRDNRLVQERQLGQAATAGQAEGKDAFEDQDAAAELEEAIDPRRNVSQAAFDRLNAPAADGEVLRSAAESPAASKDVLSKKEKADGLPGKVSELDLSSAYEGKTRRLDDELRKRARTYQSGRTEERGQRIEQSALPGEVGASGESLQDGRADLRVTTFASEVDPFEFSLLDGGEFVLYRKVWRDGQRYIQGLVLDPNVFLRDAVERQYLQTALSEMSDLVVAYRDDVLDVFEAGVYRSTSVAASGLTGALLYQNRLSAPLDSLELIFSVEALPPGPGAAVLIWVSGIIALILCGGLYVFYRLGLGQIDLANQQRDFVSAVSHELKTPLTSIRMYGEMLKDGMADPAKKKTYYEFIFDESERLSRLISNVLQLSRISRDEPQIEARTYRAGELMDQIRSRVESQVKRGGFRLNVRTDAAADDTDIHVDADCLMQIVINLVDNAIKFSGEDAPGEIDIRCEKAADGGVVFSVRDHGPGIPPGQLRKIFERFYRAEDELTRQTAGTGIGLAIVQQLAAAMGGRVDVLNRDPGAEFRVAFPAVRR